MKPLTREYFLEAAESYDGNGLAEECMLPTGPMLALLDEHDTLRAERDAYKKAKAENDDRFMSERDAARAELDLCRQTRDSLQKELDESGAELEQCRKERDEAIKMFGAESAALSKLQAAARQAQEALQSFLEIKDFRPWTTRECLACGCDPYTEYCEQCDQRRRENAAKESKPLGRAALSSLEAALKEEL